ncbi:hypothetical protein JYU34_017371 [Plutella xylostella]|uniref:Uncharacterized protein n=1 Tax=Plutella xylostella TaxID=51655 RepID=A0ABQ7PQ36_PLUXY|nr:hypothetical protein JYU34_022026 [Plutella xylostella]KAG7298913.1 hypothetical protein JYU34_017371 [Plutella xylostella]
MNDGHKPKPQSPYAHPPESPCSPADSTPNSTTSSPLYEPAEEHEERVFSHDLRHLERGLRVARPPRRAARAAPRHVCASLEARVRAVQLRCHSENVDKFAPVLNEHIPGRVIACQVVNKEADVQPALDDVHCRCRASPLVSKFVILPINEEYLIYYAKIAKEAQPNTAYLLYRDIPTSLEVDHQLAGLDTSAAPGHPPS